MASTTRERAAAKPPTTAQRLDRIVKSARKIMRKDKGLNGDLDRLPMLTWIMFLKFLDDMERIEEERAELAGRAFRPVIEPPYRWRDWAAPADGLTGADLLAFLTAEETSLPDGSPGPGLFPWLRSLRGGDGRRERRDVVATVFQGFANRMESGYLLRDVIVLIDRIHFDSSEEMHILGRLYETLLREMRDAAGDSGEFYTPRPVVRLMVEVTAPRLGETVLDPACGTGGFLVEAFEHLEGQADTVQKREILQRRSLQGGEAKSLPFLLAQMNLLLHGLEAPRIDPGNSLRFRLGEIGEDQRVNVILTNPPFGGEEEAGILNNFPEDRRTAETALLFLQLIMRRLKRGGRGRAAVVAPNGALFGDGISARVKADLLARFNLHTVVRLPEGVFAPYTDIPTNLIFFDTSGPTETIWYYEQPRPGGRRKYSKTAPLTYEEFADCLAWWRSREENERAWKVDARNIVQRDERGRVTGCNLDIKNPHAGEAVEHREPTEIVDGTIEKERRILAIMEEIKHELVRETWCGGQKSILRAVASRVQRPETPQPGKLYRQIGVRLWGQGAYQRETIDGSETKYPTLYRTHKDDIIVNKIWARNGAVAIVTDDLDGSFGSSEFPTYEVDKSALFPAWFAWFTKTSGLWAQCENVSRGTSGQSRLRPERFLDVQVPLPPLEEQRRIVAKLDKIAALVDEQRRNVQDVESLISALLHREFDVEADST